MAEIKMMSLDEFLNLAPGPHAAVGGLEFATNEVLGVRWEDSHHLNDGKGELRAFLSCPDKHARLVFLNYTNKPPLSVVISSGTSTLALSGQNLTAEVRVSGTEIQLAVSNGWEGRELEVWVARDTEKSLSLLPSRDGFAVVRLS